MEDTFSKEQLKVHGELIIEWIRNPEIKIQFKTRTSNRWRKATTPIFSPEYEYRKEPKVLFTNNMDEVFTEEDIKSDITVYWFTLKNVKICQSRLANLNPISYKSDSCNSQIYKDKVNLHKAIIEHLEKNA